MYVMFISRQALDPALRELLDAEHAALVAGAPEAAKMGRAAFIRAMLEETARTRGPIPGLPNSVTTVEYDVEGVRMRVYSPALADGAHAPTLVYLHGGGWVAGSLDTHDAFCRLLAERAQLHIASVAYRLAPEHPYPHALHDAAAALHFVTANCAEWHGDPRRIALGGDSAGGNLAAVTAHRVAATLPDLRALLLLYPVTDHPSAQHRSYDENGSGYGLDAGLVAWFWEQYAPHASPDDPQISPLRIGAIPSLPPTLVATAEYDVLRDEGIAYATRLANAGIDVTHLHAADMHHNFAVFPDTVARFPQAIETLDAIAAWLRRTLAPSSSRKSDS